jgi:hypothetical protein
MQTHERPSRTTPPRTVSQLAEPRFSEQAERSPLLSVVACALCLRVQLDSGWIEAEEAIRELRSYDLPSPIGLEPGLCDRCRAAISARRGAARVSS